MSSNVSTIITKIDASHAELVGKISALEAQIATLRDLVSAKPSSPSAPATAGGKKGRAQRAKNPDAPPREPSAWALFTKRVTALLKENGYTGKELSVIAIQFCSSLKSENSDLDSWADADILGRRAAWTAPAVSKKQESKASSVVSAPADDLEDDLDGDAPAPAPAPAPAKTGRKWSDEAKAKAAAKRAAKKSADSSAKSDGDDTASVPAPVPAPAPAPAPVAELAPSSSADGEFKPVMLAGGLKYWVNMANGHAYHRLADNSQGEWAGLFKRDPKPRVDTTVPAPSSADDEEELLE